MREVPLPQRQPDALDRVGVSQTRVQAAGACRKRSTVEITVSATGLTMPAPGLLSRFEGVGEVVSRP